MSNNVCLITGGAGFIGSYLAHELLNRGQDIYILDDLSTGNVENIQVLLDKTKFHFIQGSVLDEKLVSKLVKKCDTIYHMAAAVGVKLVFEDPIYTITTNVKGTEVILRSALKYKKKILLSSTSETYGVGNKSAKTRFKETDHSILTPSRRWCYAISKLLDEHLAKAYCMDKGLSVVICRYFNIVGPRQSGKYGMVIPRFVEWALRGEPIRIYGNGEQTRSFTWINDAIDATIRLMNSREACGNIFNIGSEDIISINELAVKVKKYTRSSSMILHIPYSDAYGEGFEDVRSRQPNIEKLKSFIKYKPSLSLDQILVKIIEYSKEKLL